MHPVSYRHRCIINVHRRCTRLRAIVENDLTALGAPEADVPSIV